MTASGGATRDEDVRLNFGEVRAERPWGQSWRQAAAVATRAGGDEQAK